MGFLNWLARATLLVVGTMMSAVTANNVSLMVVDPCCSVIALTGSEHLDGFLPAILHLVLFNETEVGTYSDGAVLLAGGDEDWALRRQIILAQARGAALALVYGEQERMSGATIPLVFFQRQSGHFLYQVLIKYPNVTLSLWDQSTGVTNATGVPSSSTRYRNFGNLVGLICGLVLGLVVVYLVCYVLYRSFLEDTNKRLVRKTKYRATASVEEGVVLPPEPVVSRTQQYPSEAVFEIVVVDVEEEESGNAEATKTCCGRWARKPTSLQAAAAAGSNSTTADSTNVFDGGGICSICLEDFLHEQDLFLLPCRHVFHPECVQSWLQDQGNCPNCKQDLAQPRSPKQRRCFARCLSLWLGHPVIPTVLALIFFAAIALVLSFTLLALTPWPF